MAKGLSCRLFYQAPSQSVNAQGGVALVAVVHGVHGLDGVEVADDVGSAERLARMNRLAVDLLAGLPKAS